METSRRDLLFQRVRDGGSRTQTSTPKIPPEPPAERHSQVSAAGIDSRYQNTVVLAADQADLWRGCVLQVKQGGTARVHAPVPEWMGAFFVGGVHPVIRVWAL